MLLLLCLLWLQLLLFNSYSPLLFLFASIINIEMHIWQSLLLYGCCYHAFITIYNYRERSKLRPGCNGNLQWVKLFQINIILKKIHFKTYSRNVLVVFNSKLSALKTLIFQHAYSLYSIYLHNKLLHWEAYNHHCLPCSHQL